MSGVVKEFAFKAALFIALIALLAVGVYLLFTQNALALIAYTLAPIALIAYAASTRKLHAYWRLSAYASIIGGALTLPFYAALLCLSLGLELPVDGMYIFLIAMGGSLTAAFFLIWLLLRAHSEGVPMPYNGYTLIFLMTSVFGTYAAYASALLIPLLRQPRKTGELKAAVQPPIEWEKVRDEGRDEEVNESEG